MNIQEKFKSLRITNYWMFPTVMSRKENLPLVKEMIEIITDRKIDEISLCGSEVSEQPLYGRKGVRFDVKFVGDAVTYILEMQNYDEYIWNRAMVYTSAEILKQMQGKGGYEEYPHTCVIFICTKKVDGENGAKHVFYQIEEVDGKVLKKKVENLIIALNTSGESEDPRLQALLRYFYKNEVSDSLTRELEEAVERIKIDGLMLESYMTFDEVIEQEKAEAVKEAKERAEKAEKEKAVAEQAKAEAEAKIRELEEEKQNIIEQNKIEICKNALSMGLPVEMIVDLTGFSKDAIEKIQKSL